MSSIDWYDANGETFANSAHVEDLPQRLRFQTYLPNNGRVLDAGCGSGRDALAFARAGYDVTAFDGSATMARLAREHTGLHVHHMRFGEIAWDQAFDGVWACASLLHLSGVELADALARVRRALKPYGVFFVSFKLPAGKAPGDKLPGGETNAAPRFANGRWFTDLDLDDLERLLVAAGFKLLEREITEDLRSNRKGERWASAIARRPLVDAAPIA